MTALLLLATLLSPLAHAANSSPEKSYRNLCVPGEIQKISKPEELEKNLAQKKGILALLDDPLPGLTELEHMAKDPDKMKSLSGQMGIVILCSLAESIQPFVEKSGCVDEAGKSHDAKAMIRQCKALAERRNAEPEEDGHEYLD